MNLAGLFSRPYFWLRKETRSAGWRSLKFPYPSLHAGKPYFQKVRDVLKASTGLEDIESLPGRQPFSTAKRYLHMVAPPLWEESERMEAEVRMAGALFLAALYSAGLHLVLWIGGSPSAGRWTVFSLLAAGALAFGFNTLRTREVGYTYLNLLVAEGMRKKLGTKGENGREEGEE
jgi:hypothetical protein